MQVKKDVEIFVGDAPQFDDMTMLCVKRNPIKTGETLEIEPNMQSIPRVKEFLTQQSQRLMVSDKQKNKFMIVMDHQPNDYEKEKNFLVDLVLSGHTHGGHLFPAGFVGLLMGANDKVYGHEKIENTDFIVTSGISGWAIPFKTGAISEYVVIDVK